MGIGTVTKSIRSAVFLDRDGVLNRSVVRNGKPYPPASVDELEVLPGVLRSLVRLKEAGFLLIAATNQPDVARGIQQREIVEAIHVALLEMLPLDDILVCYHDDDDHCYCRKPLPGLLQEAAGRHSIDMAKSFMIGDRWRDVEAGKNAGCRTILIEYKYDERSPRALPDMTVSSIVEAVEWILRAPVRQGDGS